MQVINLTPDFPLSNVFTETRGRCGSGWLFCGALFLMQPFCFCWQNLLWERSYPKRSPRVLWLAWFMPFRIRV